MLGFPEYDSYDALGLAELVRAGQVSSAELVEACISRIERLNPQINSVVFELFEAAHGRDQSVSALARRGGGSGCQNRNIGLGLLPVVETDLHGATRNPWMLDRTAGGSSGGSGASIAAGLVPMASGGDGGGSIRIPASCCGLFGHKPSRRRFTKVSSS